MRDSTRREPAGWLRASRAFGHASVRRLTRQRSDGAVRRPPAPPSCPRGWRTGPPDFVGLGSQRSGTTRWFDLIASHPQVVSRLTTKELHYFDRFHAGGFTRAHAAAYGEYFPRDGELKTGEWTPIYLAAPWIARLLAEAAPEARLLVLLRDPVERYVSGLQHDASMASEQGAPLSEHGPLQAFVRGLYHAQLSNLLAYFDRSQLLVLQYERCSREPVPELRRTFQFLGLHDTDFLPALGPHPHRQASKPALDADTRDAYVRAYRDDVQSLAASFPEIDLTLWPNFAHLSDRPRATPYTVVSGV